MFGITLIREAGKVKEVKIVLDWRHLVIFGLILSFILYWIFPPKRTPNLPPSPNPTIGYNQKSVATDLS